MHQRWPDGWIVIGADFQRSDGCRRGINLRAGLEQSSVNFLEAAGRGGDGKAAADELRRAGR